MWDTGTPKEKLGQDHFNTYWMNFATKKINYMWSFFSVHNMTEFGVAMSSNVSLSKKKKKEMNLWY